MRDMSDVQVGDRVLICTSELGQHGFDGVLHAATVLTKSNANNALKVRVSRIQKMWWWNKVKTVDLWLMRDGFFGKIEEYANDEVFLQENGIKP